MNSDVKTTSSPKELSRLSHGSMLPETSTVCRATGGRQRGSTVPVNRQQTTSVPDLQISENGGT